MTVSEVRGPVGRPQHRQWSGLFEGLLAFGTAAYPPKVRRRLRILNAAAGLMAVFSMVFALSYALQDPDQYFWVIVINLALVAFAVAAPFLHRFHELAAPSILGVAWFAALVLLVALLGRAAGIQLNFFIVAGAAFVVLGLERLPLVVFWIVLAFLLHVATWLVFDQADAVLYAGHSFLNQLYLSAAFMAFCALALIVYYAFAQAQRAEAETEALLRNILPDSIVERLKARPGEAVADRVEEATILFADLKGFVPIAASLGAARTVAMLNEMVTAFDRLAQDHGIEKIKTIGDAYMAAAGVPEPAADHALRAARFARAMLETVRVLAARFGVALNVRIGLASGPVMAGIIGTRKFTYDIWGDAVNLAARLENSSEPGMIHVSPEVTAALADAYEFQSRGPIDIKGVGFVETSFLLAPRGRDATTVTA
jgi:adenylate cyclase